MYLKQGPWLSIVRYLNRYSTKESEVIYTSLCNPFSVQNRVPLLKGPEADWVGRMYWYLGISLHPLSDLLVLSISFVSPSGFSNEAKQSFYKVH